MCGLGMSRCQACPGGQQNQRKPAVRAEQAIKQAAKLAAPRFVLASDVSESKAWKTPSRAAREHN
jgi:hypothetical protein